MPYYKPLKEWPDRNAVARTVEGLTRIRRQIREELPDRTADRRLLLGTWNIRNFDDNRFGCGPRQEESFYYLAEIIGAFDILAVQEICSDLGPLKRLMSHLGYQHKYIVTDVTEGSAGNGERLGFIYNESKVQFRGVAGEVVLPEKLLIEDGKLKRQFARTPFGCNFQSGWFKFMFSTVHIYFGKDSPGSPEYRRRVEEIDTIAKILSDRSDAEDYNYVLVGDFNIESYDSQCFNALAKHGFEVIKNDKGSNDQRTKYYDQISFKTRTGELRLAGQGNSHGVLDVFRSLYREEDYPHYEDKVKAALEARIGQERPAGKPAEGNGDATVREFYLSEWRTYQLSDHLPLWVELDIDFSDSYLQSLVVP